MTTFENKQFYQTSIASAQRTPTEAYYQTGESFFKKLFYFLCISLNCGYWISNQCEKETLWKCHLRNLIFQLSFPHFSPSPTFPVSVGVKTAYSPSPSTVYSQPPPPQRQVTALKPLAPSSSVSTSYNIYPVSTSVQQPSTPISSYNLDSTFGSTVSATTYSGNAGGKIALFLLIFHFKKFVFISF